MCLLQIKQFLASYDQFQQTFGDGFFLIIQSETNEIQVRQLKDFNTIDTAKQKVCS